MLYSLFQSVAIAMPNVLATPGTITWSLCEGDDALNNLVTVSNVVYDPPAPVLGQLSKQIVTGTQSEAVDAATGSVVVTVTMANGKTVKVKDEKFDICQDLAKNGGSCPIAAGPVTYTGVTKVPPVLIPGNYVGTSKIVTASGKTVLCVKQKFTVA